MSAARFSFIIPVIIGCAQFMHQFDGAVIATALPSMAASMHEDPVRLDLAISCYLLALAVFVPVSGWMADRFGAKRIYMLAIVIFTVSSLFCGLSQSLFEMVIWRTLQGIGGAMMTPVGRTIVVKSAPRSDLVKAMNYITIPGAFAPLLGPVVGGFIATYFSWPWIFYINLPIGFFGLVLVYFYIPEIKEEYTAPFDLIGFFLTGIALGCLVFGFEAMGHRLLPVPALIALIGTGLVSAILYVFHERRTENPIVDFSLLKISSFSASTSGGAFFYIGTTSAVFLMVLLLQSGFGYSAFHAGLIMLATAAGSLMTRFVFQPILRVLTFRQVLVYNSLLIAAYFFTTCFFSINTPYLVLACLMFIGGFARSTHFAAVQSFGYAGIPYENMSRATSFSSMSQQLSQSFGVGFVAFLVNQTSAWNGSTTLTTADIIPGFVALGLCALVSAFIFFRLPADAGMELRNATRAKRQ